MPVSFIDAPAGIRADAKKKLMKEVFEAMHVVLTRKAL